MAKKTVHKTGFDKLMTACDVFAVLHLLCWLAFLVHLLWLAGPGDGDALVLPVLVTSVFPVILLPVLVITEFVLMGRHKLVYSRRSQFLATHLLCALAFLCGLFAFLPGAVLLLVARGSTSPWVAAWAKLLQF